MTKIRVHVHRCECAGPLANEGDYGCFVAHGLTPMELWSAGWSRKPIYAINIIPKEVTSGSRTQEST